MGPIPSSSVARRVATIAVVALAMLALAAGGVADAASSGPQASVAADDAEVLVSLTPIRVLDTRPTGKLGDGQTTHLALAGPTRPLPAGATAAILNVTIDQDATRKSYMTIWPKGASRPATSANNAEPGFIAANQTIARLGNDGSVSIYNDDGAVNFTVDLVGYLVPVADVAGLAGSKFLVGGGGPGSGVGRDGDMYFDTDNKRLYGPKNGTWGAAVADLSSGAKGDKGASFSSGAGAPAGASGTNGDSYVDTTTGIVYRKASGTWSAIAGTLRGPAGPAGAAGPAGVPGPAAQVGDTTPTGACSPDGLLHLNLVGREIVLCVGGSWSGPVDVESTISGATSYGDSGASAVALDLGTSFANIATFTAPKAGTYVLDGEVTANQAAFVATSSLETVHCGWFDDAGTALGPLSSQSTPASTAGPQTPNHVDLGPKGRVELARDGTAHLRCRFSGISLGIGGFDVSGWAWEATRTP